MSPKKDPRVDAYIAKAAPFARPILKAIRKAVHRGCPDVQETLKWSAPSFERDGLLCGMAAFKAHATFGIWDHERLLGAGLKPSEEKAMGQFGRLTSIHDLPPEDTLVALVKAAVALRDAGPPRPPRPRPPKDRTVEVPDGLMAALRKNRKALATFEGFSYTNKREYVDWVTEAKREETRRRRIATAVQWMAEGKVRNWKYVRR